MRRKGVVSCFIPASHLDDYKDHIKNKYNRIVHTGNTIKKPYFCGSNRRARKDCLICKTKPKNYDTKRRHNTKLLMQEL